MFELSFELISFISIRILNMQIKKFLFQTTLLLIFAGCVQKNPYTPQKIVFVAPSQEIITKLHRKFKFDTVTFSGISLEINNARTVDFRLSVINPRFNGTESEYAYQLAKEVKDYVKNIDDFNVISVDVTFRKGQTLGYVAKNSKILFDRRTLNVISASKYFNRS